MEEYGACSAKSNEIVLKLSQASCAQDIKQLEQINQQLEQGNFSKNLKTQAFLALHHALGDWNQLDKQTRQKYKQEIFAFDNWLEDWQKLNLFAEAIPLFEDDDLAYYMGKFLKKQRTYTNLSLLQAGGHVGVSYLAMCYKQNIERYRQETLGMLKQLPELPELFVYKCLGQYFEAVFTGDFAAASELKQVIKRGGLAGLADHLPE